MDEDGALPDVDIEGVACPAAHTLYYRGWGTIFCEGCCAACAHSLTSNIGVEKLTNAFMKKDRVSTCPSAVIHRGDANGRGCHESECMMRSVKVSRGGFAFA